MAMLQTISPVFPVTNLGVAMACYRALGFTVEPYQDGTYAFALQDGVGIHLALVKHIDLATTTSAAYLSVLDADALAAKWAKARPKGRLVAPVSTGYGTREGAYVDPDGNLLRFGSVMR